MPTESEQLLVRAIRAGGPAADAACAELVARYEGRLQAFVRKTFPDPATVDDVTQEVFVGFLRGLANFDDARDLQTWLFTIASHKVTDKLRKSGRDKVKTAAGDDFSPRPDPAQRPASSIARSHERVEIEAAVVTRALRQIVTEFARKREYKRIQVLELLFVKGVRNQDVADRLGLTEQQVANYRFNAVKRLTAAVEAAGLPADVFPELAGG